MYKRNQHLPLLIVLFYFFFILFSFSPASVKGEKRKGNEKYMLSYNAVNHGNNEASKVSDQVLSQWMEYIKNKKEGGGEEDGNNKLSADNENHDNIDLYKKRFFRLLSRDTLSAFLPNVYGYLKSGYYTIFDINEWKQNNQDSSLPSSSYYDDKYVFRDDGDNSYTNHSIFEGIWAIISLITFIIFLLLCIYFCGIYGTANFFCFSIRAAKLIATSFSILSFFLVITKWYHFYSVTF